MLRVLDTESAIRDELDRRLAAGVNLLDAERLGVTRERLRAAVTAYAESDPLAEQLVTAFARPAVPVASGLGEIECRQWQRRLALASQALLHAANRVSRVWLDGHPGLRWAGTCWLITDTVAVTTRAVADECRRPGVAARVEYGNQSFAVKNARTTDDALAGPLIAFLYLDAPSTPAPPWRRSERSPAALSRVVTITYGTRDSRARDLVLDEVYARSVNQKCAAPGRLLTWTGDALLTHDCATMGISGGGPIIDLATGDPVGLHLGGAPGSPGIGLPWAVVERALQGLGERVVTIALTGLEGLEARRGAVEDYDDRVGYRRDFLGIDVPPPMPSRPIRRDVTTFAIRGEQTSLLPYTHFSVCMSQSRRMCRFTACNVEGGNLQDRSRAGIPWRLDPRLPDEQQFGNELYIENDLDRGHMVRRLDPVWGEDADAANEDTFHYTNSCPQHKGLNQKTWNDLEDYVLKNAGKHQLNINVFTGPVFRPDDPEYRDCQLPLDFWKVVVMVKDGGKLSATAYTLSQKDLVSGLEFVFGEFRTYQVPLRMIEEWTSLDFGQLRQFDPMEGGEEAVDRDQVIRVEGPDDIRL